MVLFLTVAAEVGESLVGLHLAYSRPTSRTGLVAFAVDF